MADDVTKLTWAQAQDLEEKELVRRGRDPQPQNRTGLAISGGGIRSATFALGVLEGLKIRDRLAGLSYLSTVSGGGYVGSWLSANCVRHPGWLAPAAIWTDSIKHLRRYSNYLSPKVGFLSADTWSMATIWLRNTLLIQVTVILAMACVLMVPRPLFVLFLTWPWFGQWRWITILLFLFGAVGIAGNQIRMTGETKVWFLRGDKWLPCGILGLVSLGAAWAYGHWTDFEPFRSGTIPYRQALPIAIGLVVGTFALQPVAVQIAAFIYRQLGWDPPGQVNYTQGWVQGAVVIPLMFAGFLVSAILWGESTGTAAAAASNPDLRVLSQLGSYSGFVKTAWHYWPFPLSVVFVSLVLLSLSSATWSKNWQSIAVGSLAAIVGIGVQHALLSAVMLLLHPWAVQGQAWKAFVWGPPLVATSFVITICALIGILSRQSTEGVREWWSRLGAWLGIYAMAWMFVTIIGVYSRTVVDGLLASGPAMLTTAGGWIATTLGGLLAGNSSNTSGMPKSKSVVTKVKEAVVAVAPLLFIIGLAVAVAYTLDLVVTLNGGRPWGEITIYDSDGLLAFTRMSWYVLAGCVVALLLAAWRFDLNEFGLNAFYRHRLARCYLGATRFEWGQRNPQNFTGFDDDDDLPLADLAHASGPYHIVNCALNLGGSSDLALHTRHSASFTLTPLTSGSGYESRGRVTEDPDADKASQERAREQSQVGFIRTAAYGGRDDAPTLGQAIAVSGAAASPNMGYHTSPLVAFLLTVFNLRLGWWFPNPSGSRVNRPSPVFNLVGLVSELFGGANDTSTFLMASDGGHFENLAAYELVKRRCGTIIISDGECDPNLAFEGLGTLIRMCEVDFGAKIDIDVKDIRLAGASGWSSKRHAIGTIDWGDNSPKGTLIYLKASMTGGEDTPVLQYLSNHPTFPHESTGDQFYTEDQFESYRRLGREVALEAF